MELSDLQRSICLALAVPNAWLSLRCPTGDVYRVSDHDGDLSVRQLRRATIAALHPELTDCSDWIENIHVCGALEPTRVGVHRRLGSAAPERWFATVEPPRDAAAHFRSMDLPEAARALVSIHPDRLLGAAAIRVRTTGPNEDLDRIAEALVGTLPTPAPARATARR